MHDNHQYYFEPYNRPTLVLNTPSRTLVITAKDSLKMIVVTFLVLIGRLNSMVILIDSVFEVISIM